MNKPEGDDNSHSEQDTQHQWERVLWKKQSYPDNFVGKSFFRVHTKSHKISFGQAIYGSLLVTQEICSCVGLVAVFWGISENQVNTSSILILAGVTTFFGYLSAHIPSLVLADKKGRAKLLSSYLDEIKIALFTIVLNWFSSPIIKTLTASVATDSIHACTTGLLILHLILHPYGADVAIVNPTMSHNLGLFGSVCLASRLDNNLDVFALVIVAVGLFNLLPSYRNHCKEKYGKKMIVLLTFCTFIGSFVGILSYASSLFLPFLLVIVFTSIVAPLLFIYLQPHRQNIYGPWDEALIEEKL